MKRPVVLIVGAAAVALLAAAVGASAHTGFSLTRLAGVHSAVLSDDEASGTRTETPEPSESPEVSETPEANPTAEPTEAAEPADNDNESGNNDDQGEDQHQPATQPTGSGEHDGGGGGGDDHGGD